MCVEPDLSFTGAEFADLRATCTGHPFQGGAWLAGIVEAVAPTLAAAPLIVTVRDPDTGRLIMVLPLMRVWRAGLRVIEFADLGVSDLNRIVYGRADVDLLLADGTLPGRIRAALRPGDLVSLDKMLGRDPVFDGVFGRGRCATMRVSTHPLPIHAPWTLWRETTLDPRFRRDLDTKRRRLERKGCLRTVAVGAPDEIRESFAKLRQFRARRFEDRVNRDSLANDAIYGFYLDRALEGIETGDARVFRMTSGDAMIGVIFGLYQDGHFYYLLPGFDLENYRNYSVGLLMVEDAIRLCVEAGDTIFDFTIGDYGFKTQFGTQTLPLNEVHMPLSPRGAFYLLKLELLRETKRLLKPLVARSPRLSGVHAPAKQSGARAG